jgi:hypothetical protein
VVSDAAWSDNSTISIVLVPVYYRCPEGLAGKLLWTTPWTATIALHLRFEAPLLKSLAMFSLRRCGMYEGQAVDHMSLLLAKRLRMALRDLGAEARTDGSKVHTISAENPIQEKTRREDMLKI